MTASAVPKRLGRLDGWGLLVVPAVAFLAVFFLVPMVEMAIRSLTDPSSANYSRFFGTTAYTQVLIRTFEISALITGCCLALGYPYAYAMCRAGRRTRAVLVAALLMPFWTSLLVRSFAWITLLQDTGVINNALQHLGLTSSPVGLIRNTFGVTVGMVQILLPYMVLPLYAVMQRIDLSLLDAAGGLGASPARAFRRVFLPLSLPGLYAGSLLVFVLSLGFYITPDLLGGPRQTMLGQLIADVVNNQVEFGFASAIAIVLLGITLAVLAVAARLLLRSRTIRHFEL